MTASKTPWNVLIVTDARERFSALEGVLARLCDNVIYRSPEGLVDPAGVEGCSCGLVDHMVLERAAPTLRSLGIPLAAVGRAPESPELLAALRLGARDFLSPEATPEDLEATFARLRGTLPPVAAWVEYVDAEGHERRLRLSAHRLTIGRDPSSDLRLETPTISRFHAELRCGPDGFRVVDAGSRHGVFVNGVRIREHTLRDQDQIRLGGAGAPVLHFLAGAASAPEPDAGREKSLVEASSRELKDLAALLDAFLALKGDLRLEDILQIVVDRAIELADADRGMILLLDPPAKRVPAASDDATTASEPGAAAEQPGCELRLALARNRDGTPVDESKLSISRKIPEEVVRTSCGAILEDLLAPEQFSAHPGTIEIGVRSAMCVPLLTKRTQTGPDSVPQVLGVLYVDSTAQKRPYSPRRLQAFESLAAEAAQAIFNARMYKLSLEKSRIDEEMRIARSIQQSFLPPVHHEGEWFVLHGHTDPSLEVGGDFFSYYPLEGERLGIVVGDVSGKGIPAAIFAALLDGVCYGLAAGIACQPELERLAGVLNRYLVTKTARQRFVSLFFGMVLRDGRLSYVNAGHNPPIRIDREGNVERLGTGGMILGMIEEADYEVKDTVLAPGDTLVLYSDGITEARNARGEAFGAGRLREVASASRHLSASEVHEAILAALGGFLEDRRPTDDVTLLIVRRR